MRTRLQTRKRSGGDRKSWSEKGAGTIERVGAKKSGDDREFERNKSGDDSEFERKRSRGMISEKGDTV
jgi:hypothetical protein